MFVFLLFLGREMFANPVAMSLLDPWIVGFLGGLVGTVIEDFFTQTMAMATPLDAWARAVETGGAPRDLGSQFFGGQHLEVSIVMEDPHHG